MNRFDNRDFCKMVGKNIEQIRQERGLTQEQLGKLVGVKRSSISAYEKNERYVKLDVLVNIADALEVNVLELISNDSERNLIRIAGVLCDRGKQRLCKIFLELIEELMVGE